MNNSYSILTVANREYFKFLQLFIKSLQLNSNTYERLYVADCGLGSLKKSINNTIFIETGSNIQSGEVHSDGWRLVTSKKTTVLKWLASKTSHSLIMIDSDVCVLKNLAELIDLRYDIQVVRRDIPINYNIKIFGKAGLKKLDYYISSFLIINRTDKCSEFLNDWIKLIESYEDNNFPMPHESTCFNRTLESYQHQGLLRIGYIPESKCCAVANLSSDSYSAHFKSMPNGRGADIRRRMSRFGNKLDLILAKYNGTSD